jgi:hypothetical protein
MKDYKFSGPILNYLAKGRRWLQRPVTMLFIGRCETWSRNRPPLNWLTSFFGIWWYNIATCIPSARQRLGKHIPAWANASKNRTSIARQRSSKYASLSTEAVYSLGSVQNGYKGLFDSTEHLLSRIEWSSGEGSRRWLRRNGKKGTRRCKENFICDLKWQWNCDKSVARIRLVKTENPSACATVNWKVCRIAIALYCL